MNLETDWTARLPSAASTLILLRDAAPGIEVLMLKRHGASRTLGGAFVFPGGKVDANDGRLDASAHFDATAALLHERLDEPDIDAATAGGLYVAALRETMEECGVLLAHGVGAEARGAAALLLRAGSSFNEVLSQMRLRLMTGRMVPWSRWITPERSSNRRFDTRFFVARVPADHVACHDGHETTESVWVEPRAALQAYWAGRMTLVPPQIMTLAELARYGSVDAVLQAALARRPPLIQPCILGDGQTRVMCYPGDEAHPVRRRAMPGPLRLFVRHERYEPQTGFGGFFD
ncbi:NUDIX hydrolase [Variovorax sp. 770b2]|uniref:NUDIX hydrolase n=1 Tax=Variovorax sp. 770b2 TaxID=1566271 RepID=UPI0008EEFB5F|nr:NUDIX hydrolase [Variovorax sp. 770b2]SFP26958.1 hypothetical protein SAMN03159339_1334 [Variovorax sp. 770b2]